MNIRLDIEYDGTEFFGWQRQSDRPTIQALIENQLNRIIGHKTTLYGASRTDSGVHASGQVANFFTEKQIPPDRWAAALNTQLPATIRIRQSGETASVFNAQKDAVSKLYEYRVLNSSTASALDRRVLFYRRPLDWEAVRTSIKEFLGTKDFRAFQASGSDVKTTVRTLYSFDLIHDDDGIYRFLIRGNGFLKQMVRNIIGTLLEVGEGKLNTSEIPSIFSSRNRQEAGRTVPAAGLCLVKVEYPDILEG